MYFAGQIALVTGAARGVGREAVALLHARGARVVARRTAATVLDAFGGPDILVNDAGRTQNKLLTETTAADWDTVMAVNARGSFFAAAQPLGREAQPRTVTHAPDRPCTACGSFS